MLKSSFFSNKTCPLAAEAPAATVAAPVAAAVAAGTAMVAMAAPGAIRLHDFRSAADDCTLALNRRCKRRTARCCTYLEPWHIVDMRSPLHMPQLRPLCPELATAVAATVQLAVRVVVSMVVMVVPMVVAMC